MPWESIDTINSAINTLRRANGGSIIWLPGRYEIPQPIEIWDGQDIRIEGLPGTVLTFPPSPVIQASLAADLVQGSETFLVNHPEAIQLDWRYQLYASDGSGNRLLEFRVTAIEGNLVKIHPAIRFMNHVKKIPKGSILVQRVNFFEFNRSQNITLQGLTMDGGARGSVAGHTTYCGLIAAGKTGKDKRPQSQGLTIQNCTFRDLKGRGVAIYHTARVVIEDCHFQGIAWQALEMDHYSTGAVTRNLIEDSAAGIALNDAFDTRIQFNTIRDCIQPIALYRHFNEDWINTNHEISFNLLAPRAGQPGVVFRQPMSGNRVVENYFVTATKDLWVQGAQDNHVANNYPNLESNRSEPRGAHYWLPEVFVIPGIGELVLPRYSWLNQSGHAAE